jgi:thioredoxin reductase (NADPH)
MITFEELQQVPLFALAKEADCGWVVQRGAEISVCEGDWFIREGEPASFCVLLEGELRVTKEISNQEVYLNTYGAGTFFGEVPLLIGSPVFANLRATKNCRIFKLEPHDFLKLLSICPTINEVVLKTMAERLQMVQEAVKRQDFIGHVVVGNRWSSDTHRIRDFLASNQATYRWLDVETSEKGRELAGDSPLPLVICPDGTRLYNPTTLELALHAGLQVDAHESFYDLIILGGGPAGMAAAVYGASEGLRTLVVECESVGGQAGTSSRIENYLGFPAGVSGEELTRRATEQARHFGAEIISARRATALCVDGSGRKITLSGGAKVVSHAILIATGVSYRRLGIPGEEQLTGRGFYYGGARTEAQSCRNQTVYLVGGGNSAGQAALYFSQYAQQVKIVIRGDALEKTMSHYLIQQVRTKPNVEVLTQTDVIEVAGNGRLEQLTLRERTSGACRTVPADGLFAYIGAEPATEWLDGIIRRDERGFIVCGRDLMVDGSMPPDWPLDRDPFLTETSVPGVFAAGDVRCGSVKRVASAVGEGSITVQFVHEYLRQL